MIDIVTIAQNIFADIAAFNRHPMEAKAFQTHQGRREVECEKQPVEVHRAREEGRRLI